MNHSIYSILAPFYDALNGDVDYETWADFITERFHRYEHGKTSLVLDLGCGTGSMTLALAARDYDMTGVDISPDMLNVARERAEKAGYGERILWLCQDMTELELYGTVEACVCCLDGINHLLSKEDLQATFALVHNYLSPDGLFLFDINTPYKFENVYGDRAYILEEKGTVCCWQNAYRKKSGLCDFGITLFTKEKDGRYRRTDEWQREKMYKPETIEKMLREAGFEILEKVGDTDGNAPGSDTMRLYYTARAIKE